MQEQKTWGRQVSAGCREKGNAVWLGLGSNAKDAERRLKQALEALCAVPGLRLAACSPVYRTEPQEYRDQPFFHNQVLCMRAEDFWQPVPLMRALLEAEARLGRVRSADPALRFGPRTIDIDMLLFGNDGEYVSLDPVCLLPHPRLAHRAFWLVPLRDIAPQLRIQGENADALLGHLTWSMKDRVIFQEQPGPADGLVPGRKHD